MRFLNPAGLWLLLGVPILIIIYLIKAQHEDRPVSSTYIWRLSSRFMKKRLPMQKIKKILMFAMQLAVIVSVALMAARPAFVGGDACDYIAIIDASASMQIKDDSGKSRFDYAISQVEDLANEITNGHSLSVIIASDNASYLVQGSTSLNEVKLALNNTDCSYGDCNTTEAISLAQLMCDRSDKSEVIFYTDSEYTAENVTVVNLNKNEWNISVTSLSGKADGKNTVFTGKVTSYNQETTVTVGLRIDGTVVDAQIIDCAADEETEVVFTAEGVTSYDTAEVFLETSDALAEDNSYAICRKNDKTYGVLLVSESPLYLESALNALGNCEVTVASSLEDAQLSGQDLYVFDGITPEEYPTDGSVLVFGTDNLPEGITAGETITTATALKMDNSKSSDIYTGLSFDDTVVTNFKGLTGNAYWEKLLYCDEWSVLATRKMDNGMHVSVVSFDVHDSNLPMQTDFVMFIRNLVEYSVPGLLKDTDHTAGDTVELTVMPAAEQIYVEYPDESIKSVSTANDYATVVVEEVGIYTAVMTTADGGEYVDFFVHIPDGEVTSTSGGTLEIEINTNSDIEAEQAISEIWFWIVLMMLLLILVEWGWYYHEQY